MLPWILQGLPSALESGALWAESGLTDLLALDMRISGKWPICVDAKEIERTSHRLGSDVEEFYRKEAEPFLSGKVVPIQSVPKMYVCIDGTGIPVAKAETEGRKGKGKDGHAKTREVKLGCVFTQTGLDKKGYPVRDESSTSYVGAIETADAFGKRIYAEALSRGLENAQKQVVIGDGAPLDMEYCG